MAILFNFLYILLFIFCLSILIIVHELGHFAMAKAFRVYCLEFSIGFGPKLFSFKRKNAETRFSLRGIPFGGYVSMVGEGTEVPAGIEVPESRNFNKIKKWKRIIILVAGVTMNAFLALGVFFISEMAFEQTEVLAGQLMVTENSVAASAGLQSNDRIYLDSETFGENAPIYVVDRTNAYFTYFDEDEGETTAPVIVVLSRSMPSYSQRSWSDYLNYLDPDAIDETEDLDKHIVPITADVISVTFNITKYDLVTEGEEQTTTPVSVTLEAKSNLTSPKRYFEDIGLSFSLHKYRNTFAQANKNTWNLMGESSAAIFKGLGSLFTSPGQAGGIIAVGFVTTSTLQNFGIVSFIQLWGLISINLAIINLLPFPGLDGWQIFVLIFESITKREISQKTKNIVSSIGIILLFGLMFVLLIKDVFMFMI
ncbi:MAG: site-2 protease family protein [Bacilli bacterium]|nr:site-2 protease family protein [Bacilli bacterium]